MKQLRIMQARYLSDLIKELDQPDATSRYRQPDPFELDSGRLLLAPIVPTEAAPALLCATAGGTTEEAENAIKIYRWLGTLTPTQAADPRLWATLTHTLFWGYVGKRWPALKRHPENPEDYICEHWFTKGSGKAALRRNAISRLWWAAYLTYRPWEKDPELDFLRTEDPARFTRILLSNQQISFDLLERDYGSSIRIRTCMLDALDQGANTGVPMTRLSRRSSIQLNCVARTRNLDGMPPPSLHKLCLDVVQREADALIGEA